MHEDRKSAEIAAQLHSFGSHSVGDVTETTGFMTVDGFDLLYVMTLPRGEARAWAIVVCPSMFEFSRFQPTEMIFLRRAAAAGFPGIYVEPPGMGDSQGRFEDCTLDARVRTAAAAGELLARGASQVGSTCWMGARLGATIAMLAAERFGGRGALVAWDPVPDGATYWAQARRLARITAVAQKQRSFKDPDKDLEESGRASVLWLPFTRELRGDLHNMDGAGINLHLDGPAFFLAVNDKMLDQARQKFLHVSKGWEGMSLGRDRIDHLGVTEASQAIDPTLEWMTRSLV